MLQTYLTLGHFSVLVLPGKGTGRQQFCTLLAIPSAQPLHTLYASTGSDAEREKGPWAIKRLLKQDYAVYKKHTAGGLRKAKTVVVVVIQPIAQVQGSLIQPAYNVRGDKRL